MTQPYYPATRVGAENKERRVDDDTIYWRRMEQLSVFSEVGLVTSVTTSPVRPFHVASTSGMKMTMYDTHLCEPINQFSRFKHAVYGAEYRKDGQLIALGGEEGRFRVFDSKKSTGTQKIPIRSVKVGNCPLHTVRFSTSGTKIFTMAGDGYMKCYDLPDTGLNPLWQYKGHDDMIRAGAISKFNENLVLSGGYDHKVKLWDIRTAPNSSAASMVMDVGLPVEDMVLLPNENLIATASGPIVKIWDLLAGGRLLTSIQAHHKTITSLCLVQDGGALLSGGIDKRINVIRISDFNICHTITPPAPVLALAMTADDDTMAIGMGNLLSLYRRAPVRKSVISLDDAKSRRRVAAPAVIVQERGEPKVRKELTAKGGDQLHLSRMDQILRKFKHHMVVQKLCQTNYFMHQPNVAVGYLRVLAYRKVIRASISGHTPVIQVKLLKFLTRNLPNHAFFETLFLFADAAFDVFSQNEELDPEVAKQLLKLKDAVSREITLQKQLNQTLGAFELILNSAKSGSSVVREEEEDIFGEPLISALRLNLDIGNEEKSEDN